MLAEENTSKITLLTSLLFHLIIIAALTAVKQAPYKKVLQGLELNYVSGKKVAYLTKKTYEREQIRKEKKLPNTPNIEKKLSKITTRRRFKIPSISKPRETAALSKPKTAPERQKVKKITLKNVSQEASKDPAYLNYRGKIRKKIQEKVYAYSEEYFYFESPREGKIFVSFTINNNGTLNNFDILEEKSAQNPLLQKIVIAAINSASPFDKFPPDLRYDLRTFHLEISFEVE